MRAARANRAARQAHRELILGCGRSRRSQFLLAQREVHALGSHRFERGHPKERAQRLLGAARARAANAEIVAAAADLDIQTHFEQAQIFIQRPAQVCQARVVGGLEQEFARVGSGYSGHGLRLHRRPRTAARAACDAAHR